MKTLRLVKLISMSSVLMLAMAFSCQDHHVPEPVSNCNRVDGTPRAFPCEFQILKLEFLRTNTSQVVKTVVPGSPDVALPLVDAEHFQYGSQRSYVIVDYRVRLHVKRIAAPSFTPVTGYETMYFQLSPPDPPYPPLYNDILTDPRNAWMIPASPAKNPVTLDMPVGETRTIETKVNLVFDLTPTSSRFLGEVIFGVSNNTTARTLIAAPYHYNLIRDAHEAWLPFAPSVY